MFLKSIKDFFHNPIVAIPNILISLVMAILSDSLMDKDYLTNLASDNTLINYNQVSSEAARYLSFLLLLLLFYALITPLINGITNLMICKIINASKADFILSIRTSTKYYIRLFCAMVFKFLVYILLVIIFGLASIPSLIAINNNPEHTPIALLVILILLIVSIIVATVILSPIEAILVHDNLSIAEAISKGFRFGFKRFFKLLGCGTVITVVIAAVDLLTYRLLPNTTSISTLLSSLVYTLFTIYILNLYKKNPL